MNAIGPHETQWRGFERLVAAIHRARAADALVAWNEKIKGRQFDVTMRFRVGTYDYLTVIECKSQDRPVAVEDVEAFVTKAADAGADKAILVSASGFQTGAIAVAERHSIELFTLTRLEEVPDDILLGGLVPCLRLHEFRWRLAQGGSWLSLPETRNMMPFLANNLTVRSRGGPTRTLDLLVSEIRVELDQRANGTDQLYSMAFPAGSVAHFPHLVEDHEVSELQFLFRVDSFRRLVAPGFDPHSLTGVYEYTNTLTGESIRVPKKEVANRFPTVLMPGHFYLSAELEYSYYCKSIAGGNASMLLLESYQHGRLIQAAFKQDIQHQGGYVEITDTAEIDRLRRVGKRVLEAHGAA